MASIADLYKDEYTASKDRLLSARSGVSNILANAHKDAGWAQPGVAMLQGQEAARIGSEAQRGAQRQEFFQTFGKLLVSNGGAAAKFWTDHAASVGIDAPIDSIDAKPAETTVSFQNGVVAIINKAKGTVQTPDGQGGMRDWTDADTEKFENNFKEKTTAGNKAKGASEDRKDVRDIRAKIAALTANINTAGYANNPATKAQVDSEINSLKSQYKEITGKDYDPEQLAPPPSTRGFQGLGAFAPGAGIGAVPSASSAPAPSGGGWIYKNGKLVKQ